MSARVASTLSLSGLQIGRLYEQSARSDSPFGLMERWDLSSLLGRTVTSDEPATFAEMLPLWVGNTAISPVDSERIETYLKFLSRFVSELRFFELLYDIAGHRNASRITEADLSALHGLVYVLQLAKTTTLANDRLTVLEVGGGYGLLGAMLHRHATTGLQYIAVDAVPESCAYCAAYLEAMGHRVNVAANAAAVASDIATANHECLVVPAWLADTIEPESIDIIVNFSSIQEMPDQTARAYLEAFPRWLRTGGALLFANSRDFFYQREYRIAPPLYIEEKRYTPRSRSHDFPIESFRKLDRAPDWTQRDLEIDYYIELKHRLRADAKDRSDAQQTRIANLTTKLKEAQAQNKASRTADQKQLRNLRDRLTDRSTRLRSRIEQLEQKIVDQKARIKDLVSQRKALTKSHSQKLQELRDRRRSDNQSAQKRIDSLQERLVHRDRDYRREVEQLSLTVEQLRGKIEELEQRHASAHGRQEIPGSLEGPSRFPHGPANTETATEIQRALSEANRLNARIDEQQRRIERQASRIEQQNQTIAQQQDRIEQLVSQAKATASDQAERIQKLQQQRQSDLRAARERTDLLRHQAAQRDDALKSRIAQQTELILRLRSRIEDLVADQESKEQGIEPDQ